ncbi:MAG: F0F1 ATP synthase subunit B [Saezia sp.]
MNINATLVIQIIVFALLVFFTMRFIWPPVANALDERARKIADGLAAAERAQEELDEVGKRVDEQLSQTREETKQRLVDADKRGQDIVSDAKQRAESEAQKIVEQAKFEAEQQVVQVREALRQQVSVLALKGAEQILGREVDAKAHADILERLKAEL